jgi:hypothetical protein
MRRPFGRSLWTRRSSPDRLATRSSFARGGARPMVAGIHVKGKGPAAEARRAAAEGAGQVRAGEPRAPL